MQFKILISVKKKRKKNLISLKGLNKILLTYLQQNYNTPRNNCHNEICKKRLKWGLGFFLFIFSMVITHLQLILNSWLNHLFKSFMHLACEQKSVLKPFFVGCSAETSNYLWYIQSIYYIDSNYFSCLLLLSECF